MPMRDRVRALSRNHRRDEAWFEVFVSGVVVGSCAFPGSDSTVLTANRAGVSMAAWDRSSSRITWASGIPRVGQEPLQVPVDAVPLLRECGDVTRRLSTDPRELVGGKHDPRTRASFQCALAEHTPNRAVGALSAAGE
jgi:hypothetical protein